VKSSGSRIPLGSIQINSPKSYFAGHLPFFTTRLFHGEGLLSPEVVTKAFCSCERVAARIKVLTAFNHAGLHNSETSRWRTPFHFNLTGKLLAQVARQGKVGELVTEGGLKADGHNLPVGLKRGPVSSAV